MPTLPNSGNRLPASPDTSQEPKLNTYIKLGSLLGVYYEQRRLGEFYKDIATACVPSEQHPSDNQDAFFSDPTLGAFGVFDGLGGHSGGGWAAQFAANKLQELVARIRTQDGNVSAANISVLFNAIDEELFSRGNGYSRLTTGVLLAEHSLHNPNNRLVTIAKAGDSRAYLLRSGELHPLTVDHGGPGSFKYPLEQDGDVNQQELLAQVLLAEADYSFDLIETEPELRLPQRFRTRNYVSGCLGGRDSAEISTTTLAVCKGDIILLSTDGIHDNLKDSQIAAILNDNCELGAQAITAKLIDMAQAISRLDPDDETARAKPDDMTAIVIMF